MDRAFIHPIGGGEKKRVPKPLQSWTRVHRNCRAGETHRIVIIRPRPGEDTGGPLISEGVRETASRGVSVVSLITVKTCGGT